MHTSYIHTGAFACMVDSYWTGPKGFKDRFPKGGWPNAIWDKETKCGGTSSGKPLNTLIGDKDKNKNAESNPANQVPNPKHKHSHTNPNTHAYNRI